MLKLGSGEHARIDPSKNETQKIIKRQKGDNTIFPFHNRPIVIRLLEVKTYRNKTVRRNINTKI